MYQVIDSDDYAASGIQTMIFPGGEPHVKIDMSKINTEEQGRILLFFKLRSWLDVGFALLILDALDRERRDFTMFMPYFPGARQDKTSPGTAGTLDVILNLFNCYGTIHVFDPHSDHLGKRGGVHAWMPADLPLLTAESDVVGVIAPDAGAMARASAFRDVFYPNMQLYTCTKSRDPATGALSNYIMPKLNRAGRYVIVDDICDGGGTFNLLADEFGKQNNSDKKLSLFVSHGIFSKGLENIDDTIDRITTTDSWCMPTKHPYSRRIAIMGLNTLFPKIMED